MTIFSPEEEDVCRYGEVPLVVKHNDTVLREGKIGVTIPAFQFTVILQAHPCVKELWQHNVV